MHGPNVLETVERKTLKLDGCTVSYQRSGTGAPLLFLHGAGGVPGWLPFMERLAESYDLIVPDHPGFGQSEIPAWLDNIHDLAFFYLDFIKALGLRDIHLVGNSLGGWIACELAVRQTHDLKTLTLLSPAGLRVKGQRKLDTFLMAPQEITRKLFADQSFADRLLAHPLSEEQVELQVKNAYSFARVAWQPRFFDPHLAKWMHRIDVPTLIVWGASDALIPVAYADEFARLIPEADKVIFPACGHLPHVEKTDQFLTALAGFIAQKGT
jgi:pimeloyl-ACP methyl ester carboxylesterase